MPKCSNNRLLAQGTAGVHRKWPGCKYRSPLPAGHRQVVARILPLPIDDDFEMHMAPSGIARCPGQRNDLALDHEFANAYQQQRIVAVSGLHPMPMANGDPLAGMARPTGHNHPAGLTGPNRRAAGNGIILADVDLVPGTCRVGSPAERTGDLPRGHRVLQLQAGAQHGRPDLLGRGNRCGRHCHPRTRRCRHRSSMFGNLCQRARLGPAEPLSARFQAGDFYAGHFGHVRYGDDVAPEQRLGFRTEGHGA